MDIAKILIIEDERKIADTLQIGLAEHDYEVHVAYDGSTGMEIFLRERFNLIILDINLPDFSGFEICKKIRQHNNNVPIIMLTSMGALRDKEEGYHVGADDYLVKPFEFRELLLKIKVLLRRNQKGENTAFDILQVGDLKMNLDNKEVTRGKNRIILTKKEFELLEYLLKNLNKVVTRADIALHVWDIDFNTKTNIIDVYVNYLRNKIDKDFFPKLIHTQTGVGYILKSK